METAATTVRARPVGFIEKVRVAAAGVVAVVLIGYVGWLAAPPADPEMGVTFTAGGRSVLAAWVILLALTLVAAAVGSAIAGPRLPEAGLFAAAVGLAGLALRGGSMEVLLGYVGDASAADRRYLMLRMGLDAVLWAGLLAVAWLAVQAVWRWVWNGGVPRPVVGAVARGSVRKGNSPGDLLSGGPMALGVTAVVALFFIWTTVARTPVANIARGQVIASVFFGLYLGAMAGRHFTGVGQARYYMAAPLVVALVGFSLGYLQANMGWARGALAAYAQLATIPPHALARPLPIEYIAVGLAGAIAGFWSGRKIDHGGGQEPSSWSG